MSELNPNRDNVLAVDEQVGGDDDQPGITQPITQAEVDDILNDPNMSMEERQARLQELSGRIGTRENADRGGEFSPLEAQIEDALRMLAEGGHDYGGSGLDPDDRSDAWSPDDDRNS